MIRCIPPRTRRPLLLIALAAVLLPAACSDDNGTEPEVDDPVVYIHVDGTNGSPDGAGTAGDPLADLQAGIELAAAEQRDVRVAEGLYLVNSALGSAIAADSTVSLFGGYRNSDGQWSRDPETYVTIVRDVAVTGGTHDAPRCAIACDFGATAAPPPVIDGFRFEGGGGDMSAAVFIGDGTSVTIRNCSLHVGAATRGFGIKNWSTDRDSPARVVISDCFVEGGGGDQATGIYVSRSGLLIENTVVSGMIATSRVFAVDCGYGDVVISGCDISGGTAPNSTRGLYLNEAYTCSVTGCTISGGGGGGESYGIQAMDTEQESSISDNVIDGGSGTKSVALELGWVEVNPSVDDNVLTCTGGTDRYGIFETGDTADPVSLTGNSFRTTLLSGGGLGVLYHDFSANTATDIETIEALNRLDEDGLNPAGSVSDNVLSAR